MIGFAMCGSFCTHDKALAVLEELRGRGYDVLPVLSHAVYETDTRFGTADALLTRVRALCGHDVIHTVAEAEPLGPATPMEALIIAPCTGNTLAKLANGITDSAVTMAAKAHLRNGRPLVISFSTNDGLSGSAENIAKLLNRKNVYFVPFRQDDPAKKPRSLQADFTLIDDTLKDALCGIQLQPILL